MLGNFKYMQCAEGIFISLSTENNLHWTWESVREHVKQYIEEDDEDFFKKFSRIAKTNGDHCRSISKNKVYQAPWAARIAEMIGKLKHDYDTDRKMTTLTNMFAQDYK